MKKNNKIIDFNIILIGLSLAGVTYWKTYDILFSFQFMFFTFGTYYIIWCLIIFFNSLKLNLYRLKKTICEINTASYIYFCISILILLFVLPKLLLFIFIGLIIFIPFILLIIEVVRSLFK